MDGQVCEARGKVLTSKIFQVCLIDKKSGLGVRDQKHCKMEDQPPNVQDGPYNHHSIKEDKTTDNKIYAYNPHPGWKNRNE